MVAIMDLIQQYLGQLLFHILAKTTDHILVADLAQGTFYHVDPSLGKIEAILNVYPVILENAAFHSLRQERYFYYTPSHANNTEIMRYVFSEEIQSPFHQSCKMIIFRY